MKKRSTDFWLSTALVLVLFCAAATALAHLGYTHAEAAYHTRLAHITFTPHGTAVQALNRLNQAAGHRLHLQTLLGALTFATIINVLVQVVRHRNERLALAATETEG